VEALLSPSAIQRFPDLDNHALQRFADIYGPAAYVCRYIHCSKATDGFESASQRDNHESQHQRQFRCEDDSCASFPAGFLSRSLLVTHMSRCHSSPSQILDLKKQAEQGSPGSTFAAGTRGLTVDANWQYEHDPADSAYETGTHAPSLDPSKPVVHGPADSTYASGNLGKPGPYTAHTIYSASETSTLPPLKERHFIADLAEELFNKIKSSALGRADLERISEKLPRLLRSFALRIGYKAQTGMHRDVSYFVHKYRG